MEFSMLFEKGENIFESEKERNFYMKFFAGYFLNDLIDGSAKRLSRFWDILLASWRNSPDSQDSANPDNLLRSENQVKVIRNGDLSLATRPKNIDPESAHVSFDNHAYMLGATKDRGEFADVLIYDHDNNKVKTVIAVEVKYLSYYKPDKDIRRNADRIKWISKNMAEVLFIPCLLLSKHKWERSQPSTRMKAYDGSNIIFWEYLVAVCEDKIKEYFTYQLDFLKKYSDRNVDLRYEIGDNTWARIAR
jgi:hypothetical protein